VKEGTTDIDTPNLPGLYLRGGSIVPTGPLMQYADEKPLSPVTLLICPDTNGAATGILYEDAGDGFDLQNGAYRLTTYLASLTGGNLIVTSAAEGQWPATFRPILVRVFWHGEELTASGREGESISIPLPSPPAAAAPGMSPVKAKLVAN
jgi:Domain of unknown function (DUF5110)